PAAIRSHLVRRNSAALRREDHDGDVVRVEAGQASTTAELELRVEVVAPEKPHTLSPRRGDQIRVERRADERCTRHAVLAERRRAVTETVRSCDQHGRRHKRAGAREHTVVEIRDIRMPVPVRLTSRDRRRRRRYCPKDDAKRRKQQDASHWSFPPFWRMMLPALRSVDKRHPGKREEAAGSRGPAVRNRSGGARSAVNPRRLAQGQGAAPTAKMPGHRKNRCVSVETLAASRLPGGYRFQAIAM